MDANHLPESRLLSASSMAKSHFKPTWKDNKPKGQNTTDTVYHRKEKTNIRVKQLLSLRSLWCVCSLQLLYHSSKKDARSWRFQLPSKQVQRETSWKWKINAGSVADCKMQTWLNTLRLYTIARQKTFISKPKAAQRPGAIQDSTLSLPPLNQTHLQCETQCSCIRPFYNSAPRSAPEQPQLWIYFWLWLLLFWDLIWRLLPLSNTATVEDVFLVKINQVFRYLYTCPSAPCRAPSAVQPKHGIC